MPRMAGKMLVFAVILVTSGCGTMGNLSHPDKIYGGTQLDGAAVLDACKEIVAPAGTPQLTTAQAAVMLTCGCLDLPLSVLGDTATLPITVPINCYRWWKGTNEPPGAVEAVPTAPVSAEKPAGGIVSTEGVREME